MDTAQSDKLDNSITVPREQNNNKLPCTGRCVEHAHPTYPVSVFSSRYNDNQRLRYSPTPKTSIMAELQAVATGGASTISESVSCDDTHRDACVMTSDFEYVESEFGSSLSISSCSSVSNVSLLEDLPAGDSATYDVILSYQHSCSDVTDLSDSTNSDMSNTAYYSFHSGSSTASPTTATDTDQYNNNATSRRQLSHTPDAAAAHVCCDVTCCDCLVFGAMASVGGVRRGLWCERCNSRLVELKRQAIKMWLPFASRRGRLVYEVSTNCYHSG